MSSRAIEGARTGRHDVAANPKCTEPSATPSPAFKGRVRDAKCTEPTATPSQAFKGRIRDAGGQKKIKSCQCVLEPSLKLRFWTLNLSKAMKFELKPRVLTLNPVVALIRVLRPH